MLLLINEHICHRTVFTPSITLFPNDSVIKNRFTCIRNHKFETTDSGIVWCLIFLICLAFLYQLETYAHFKISTRKITDSHRIVLIVRWFLSLMPFLFFASSLFSQSENQQDHQLFLRNPVYPWRAAPCTNQSYS